MLYRAPRVQTHLIDVNLGKIKKKLKREITAHPAKAAVLGILCVVAIWFWVPLVWGWVSPPNKIGATPPAQTTGIPSLPTLGPTIATAESTKPSPSAPDLPWPQVIEWMEQDPRTRPMPMTSASPQVPTTSPDDTVSEPSPATARNPFTTPASSQEAIAAREAAVAAEVPARPPEITPQDAGAAVSAVIASPTGGTAMINGRTYFLGEQVILWKDNQTYSYQLARIHPGGVVLSRNGTEYELNIPTPANALRPAVQADESAKGPTP